jgi:hypothetical protein
MRHFRVLLAFLLCLALPVHALAGAISVLAGCPAAKTSHEMQVHATTPHDCCKGHASATDSKHCQGGADCKCYGHVALASLPLILAGAPLDVAYSAPGTVPPHPSSSAIWRPPASL